MFGFVTWLSQQCLAHVGSSTEEIGVYLSWDPAVPCPRSSAWWQTSTTSTYHTVGLFPTDPNGKQKMYLKGTTGLFSSPRCHRLAFSERTALCHFMLSFLEQKPTSPRTPRIPEIGAPQLISDQASEFLPHWCMLLVPQPSSQAPLQNSSPTDPDLYLLTPESKRRARLWGIGPPPWAAVDRSRPHFSSDSEELKKRKAFCEDGGMLTPQGERRRGGPTARENGGTGTVGLAPSPLAAQRCLPSLSCDSLRKMISRYFRSVSPQWEPHQTRCSLKAPCWPLVAGHHFCACATLRPRAPRWRGYGAEVLCWPRGHWDFRCLFSILLCRFLGVK